MAKFGSLNLSDDLFNTLPCLDGILEPNTKFNCSSTETIGFEQFTYEKLSDLTAKNMIGRFEGKLVIKSPVDKSILFQLISGDNGFRLIAPSSKKLIKSLVSARLVYAEFGVKFEDKLPELTRFTLDEADFIELYSREVEKKLDVVIYDYCSGKNFTELLVNDSVYCGDYLRFKTFVDGEDKICTVSSWSRDDLKRIVHKEVNHWVGILAKL